MTKKILLKLISNSQALRPGVFPGALGGNLGGVLTFMAAQTLHTQQAVVPWPPLGFLLEHVWHTFRYMVVSYRILCRSFLFYGTVHGSFCFFLSILGCLKIQKSMVFEVVDIAAVVYSSRIMVSSVLDEVSF